jgi:hypothetical protein
MKMIKSPTSPARRLLTSLVGFVFLCSAVMAQLPFCQCGIFCLHGAPAQVAEVGEGLPADDHGCCPSERQDDAAPVTPSQEDGSCEDEGACDCPVELSSSQDLPPAPIPSVISSVDIHAELLSPVATSSELPFLAGNEDASRWRPTRGSPLSRVPLHVLNSVYII